MQRVFIIVFNGHEAAVTTVTAHESEGEGVVVIVDLGGSYRLQNFGLTSYLNLLLPDQKKKSKFPVVHSYDSVR